MDSLHAHINELLDTIDRLHVHHQQQQQQQHQLQSFSAGSGGSSNHCCHTNVYSLTSASANNSNNNNNNANNRLSSSARIEANISDLLNVTLNNTAAITSILSNKSKETTPANSTPPPPLPPQPANHPLTATNSMSNIEHELSNTGVDTTTKSPKSVHSTGGAALVPTNAAADQHTRLLIGRLQDVLSTLIEVSERALNSVQHTTPCSHIMISYKAVLLVVLVCVTIKLQNKTKHITKQQQQQQQQKTAERKKASRLR